MPAVNYFTEDISFSYPSRRRTTAWIKRTAEGRGRALREVNLIFCSDPYLAEINATYLKHDTYTDIITFDNSEDEMIEGDIFISVDRVRDNASRHEQSFDQEMRRVIIHGILHLLGLKDKTDDQKMEMRRAEEIALMEY